MYFQPKARKYMDIDLFVKFRLFILELAILQKQTNKETKKQTKRVKDIAHPHDKHHILKIIQ